MSHDKFTTLAVWESSNLRHFNKFSPLMTLPFHVTDNSPLLALQIQYIVNCKWQSQMPNNYKQNKWNTNIPMINCTFWGSSAGRPSLLFPVTDHAASTLLSNSTHVKIPVIFFAVFALFIPGIWIGFAKSWYKKKQ